MPVVPVSCWRAWPKRTKRRHDVWGQVVHTYTKALCFPARTMGNILGFWGLSASSVHIHGVSIKWGTTLIRDGGFRFCLYLFSGSRVYFFGLVVSCRLVRRLARRVSNHFKICNI